MVIKPAKTEKEGRADPTGNTYNYFYHGKYLLVEGRPFYKVETGNKCPKNQKHLTHAAVHENDFWCVGCCSNYDKTN